VRHADEQYAWPRSHAVQIAKRRLQSRHVFWRSGVSTTSERRHTPTGHARQTVAQREPTGSVRRSIEAVTEGLEVVAPGPHLVCDWTELTRPPVDTQVEEAVDADGAMDAQTRPQLLAKPRRRGFARAPTAIIFFVNGDRNGKTVEEQSRFLRFYVVSDTSHHPRQGGRLHRRRHPMTLAFCAAIVSVVSFTSTSERRE
jgi:hypothetical protein